MDYSLRPCYVIRVQWQDCLNPYSNGLLSEIARDAKVVEAEAS